MGDAPVRKRFVALGHRIPTEAGLLALWRSIDARAAQVAILSRRVGHLTDDGLIYRLWAIVAYGQALNVMAEAVEAAQGAERRVARA